MNAAYIVALIEKHNLTESSFSTKGCLTTILYDVQYNAENKKHMCFRLNCEKCILNTAHPLDILEKSEIEAYEP